MFTIVLRNPSDKDLFPGDFGLSRVVFIRLSHVNENKAPVCVVSTSPEEWRGPLKQVIVVWQQERLAKKEVRGQMTRSLGKNKTKFDNMIDETVKGGSGLAKRINRLPNFPQQPKKLVQRHSKSENQPKAPGAGSLERTQQLLASEQLSTAQPPNGMGSQVDLSETAEDALVADNTRSAWLNQFIGSSWI